VVSAGYYYPGPYYYDGYSVYYDEWGRAVYFVAGVRYYVPRGYRYYRPIVRYHRLLW
jgi:hypothetical protein